VESEVTPLFVDDSPVDSDVSLLCAVLSPVEAEVESEPIPLALVLIPDDADVEIDLTPLFVEDRPVESDVSLL
jgi:hypothetical protein